MHIPEIIEVKEHLQLLKNGGMISEWELPYEQLLTRRSAAIFFVTPNGNATNELWSGFEKFDNFSWRANEEKKLSSLEYRVTFSKEEKEKNNGK